MASPNFYQGASNFSIGTSNVTIHTERPQTLLGILDPPHPIPNADHNRNRKTSPPNSACLPGTRLTLLSHLLSWSQSSSSEVVLWLCGSVGSGKSAIAQSLAEDLALAHRLAASFFFFRGSGERSKFARVPITLASQVAVNVPKAKRHIMDAIGRFSGWSVSKQMEEFVYRPVQIAFNDTRPNEGDPVALTIVIDGLDECVDREEVEEFIEHLLSYFSSSTQPPPLKFVISSRIESHIQSLLETHSVRIENLSNYLPHADIHTLLTTTFTRAFRQNRVIRAYGAEWPSPLELDTLLRHISGSFIFASTLLKYILGPPTSDGLTPMERLPLALLLNPGLDGLYASTLARCRTFPHFPKLIASIALLSEPLSVAGLSWLIGAPSFQVLNILVNLQAIIHVPGNDYAPVSVFHTSLRDFLTTESRSGPLFVSRAHHEWLAFRWLEAEGVPSGASRSSSSDIEFCCQCFRLDCHTLSRASFHWQARWSQVTIDTSKRLRFMNSVLGHFFDFPPGKVTHDHVECTTTLFPLLSVAAGHRPLWELVRLVPGFEPDSLPLEFASLGLGACPQPHASTLIVRAGIRFFTGTLRFETGSQVGDYVLRYWVKHLADAVLRDPGFTVEELRGREYRAVKHGFHRYLRTRMCSISLSFGGNGDAGGEDGDGGVKSLRDDVRRAERAVRDRFPKVVLPDWDSTDACPNFKASFHGSRRLAKASRPEITEEGISILDVLNAYRYLAFIVDLMEQSPPGKGLGRFDVTFTNERRNNLRSEVSFRRYAPDQASGESKVERPVYIVFCLDYFVF